MQLLDGALANLPEQITEGTIYITTDERGMYVDIDESNRIRIGDFIEVADVAALANEKTKGNVSTTALYYAKKENVLAKYEAGEEGDGKFVEINRNTDTGATAVQNTGDGYVEGDSPKLSYDAGTRTITLTFPKKLATEEFVTGKLGDIGASTVADFVTQKISEISSQESDLEERVGTLETQITQKANSSDLQDLSGKVDTLTDNVGETPVSDQISEAIEALALETIYAKSETVSALDTKVQALETNDKKQDTAIQDLQGKIGQLSGAMHFKGTVETDPSQETPAGSWVAGDVVIFGNKEYVYDDETSKFVEFGDVTEVSGRVSTLETWEAAAKEQITALETASGTHALQTALEAEVTRAKGEEQKNATAISEEAATARAAEQANATAIQTEVTTARAAEAKALADAKAYTDQEIGKLHLGIEWGSF